MGVYIKGMEMPNDCRECPMQVYYSSGKTWCKSTNMILAEDYKPIPFDGRPKWSPLVEVPEPHGDLIDRDEVRKAVIHHLGIKGEEYLLPAEKSLFGNIIKAQPVIKAEGTNEGSN